MKRLCLGYLVLWAEKTDVGFSCGFEKFERYSVEVSDGTIDGYREVTRCFSMKRARQEVQTIAARLKLKLLDAEVIVRVVDRFTGYECGSVKAEAYAEVVVSGYVGRRKI